jgi:hypothetical protein
VVTGERYRCDPAQLIAALTEPELLARYQEAVAAEVPSLADNALLGHLRRLLRWAAQAQTGGFAALARVQPAEADALLSDVFAVATWQGWPLPIQLLESGLAEVAGLPRGLLGQDPGGEGASVWVLDHATVLLARARSAGTQALWHQRVVG